MTALHLLERASSVASRRFLAHEGPLDWSVLEVFVQLGPQSCPFALKIDFPTPTQPHQTPKPLQPNPSNPPQPIPPTPPNWRLSSIWRSSRRRRRLSRRISAPCCWTRWTSTRRAQKTWPWSSTPFWDPILGIGCTAHIRTYHNFDSWPHARCFFSFCSGSLRFLVGGCEKPHVLRSLLFFVEAMQKEESCFAAMPTVGKRVSVKTSASPVKSNGCGSKLNSRGYAGVGPCFHLPGFQCGTVFRATAIYAACRRKFGSSSEDHKYVYRL